MLVGDGHAVALNLASNYDGECDMSMENFPYDTHVCCVEATMFFRMYDKSQIRTFHSETSKKMAGVRWIIQSDYFSCFLTLFSRIIGKIYYQT